MKLPFTIGNRPIQGNFDFLLNLLGSKNWRSGSDTLTFSASTQSTNKVVTHGLGAEPTAVLAVARGAVGNVFCLITAKSSTTFTVVGIDKDTARTGTETFYWIAST